MWSFHNDSCHHNSDCRTLPPLGRVILITFHSTASPSISGFIKTNLFILQVLPSQFIWRSFLSLPVFNSSSVVNGWCRNQCHHIQPSQHLSNILFVILWSKFLTFYVSTIILLFNVEFQWIPLVTILSEDQSSLLKSWAKELQRLHLSSNLPSSQLLKWILFILSFPY